MSIEGQPLGRLWISSQWPPQRLAGRKNPVAPRGKSSTLSYEWDTERGKANLSHALDPVEGVRSVPLGRSRASLMESLNRGERVAEHRNHGMRKAVTLLSGSRTSGELLGAIAAIRYSPLTDATEEKLKVRTRCWPARSASLELRNRESDGSS